MSQSKDAFTSPFKANPGVFPSLVHCVWEDKHRDYTGMEQNRQILERHEPYCGAVAVRKRFISEYQLQEYSVV